MARHSTLVGGGRQRSTARHGTNSTATPSTAWHEDQGGHVMRKQGQQRKRNPRSFATWIKVSEAVDGVCRAACSVPSSEHNVLPIQRLPNLCLTASKYYLGYYYTTSCSPRGSTHRHHSSLEGLDSPDDNSGAPDWRCTHSLGGGGQGRTREGTTTQSGRLHLSLV